MIWGIILEALRDATSISVFVVVLMTVIEVINQKSKGKLLTFANESHVGTVLISSVLGVIPGCLGGLATTSMYNRKLITFGALMAMMVSTCGDEAFIMLATMPKTAIIIFCGLFILSLIVGFGIDLIGGKKKQAAIPEQNDITQEQAKERWYHVILHHFPEIFLWTFGIMAATAIAQNYLDINNWISQNTALMIVLATLIGCIPESGPHIIFITLYVSGVIPLPVLLASCISQDGHAALPLIAVDKKSFIKVKLIKCALALAVGFIALLF